VLSAEQVARLAIRAGFSARDGTSHVGSFSQAAVAVAIARLESGFNANAVNRSSGATGVWQIHYPGQPTSGTPALMNPSRNAAAARAKYLSQGWKAWSVYPQVAAGGGDLVGAENTVRRLKGRPRLDPGKVQEITPGSLAGDVAGGVLGGLTGWVGDLLGGLLPLLKIAAGGAGLLICAIALVYVAGRNTPPVQAARQAAQLVPAGRFAARASRSRSAGGAARQAGRDLGEAVTPTRPDQGSRGTAAARLQAAEARSREARARASEREAKARTARSEAFVARGYAAEARRARKAQVLPRIEGARRSRPSNYVPPGNRRPQRTGVR